jgi:uncharacterized membrane protein
VLKHTSFLATALGLALCLVFATLVTTTAWAQVAAVLLGRRNLWDAGDFATLYSAAQLVGTGHAHGLYHIDTITSVRIHYTSVQGADRIAYLNPPFFAAALAPLTLLSFSRAYQVWVGINLAFTLATCWMIWRTMAPLPRWQRAILAAALLTAYPLTLALRLGQFSAILMTSWTAAYLFLREGRDRAAGVAFAALVIKPELLIPAAGFLLWKRRCAVFSTLVPVAAVAVVASFAVVGPSEGLHYPVFIVQNARNSGNGTLTQLMFGWNGWLGAFLGREQPLRTTLLSLPLTGATLGAVAYMWRGSLRVQSASFPNRWLALTLATLLADPNLFLQDMIIVIPPACALFAASEGRVRTAVGGALGLGWMLSAFGLDPGSLWHFNVLTTELAACLALLIWYDRRSSLAAAVGAPAQSPRTAALDADPADSAEDRAA